MRCRAGYLCRAIVSDTPCSARGFSSSLLVALWDNRRHLRKPRWKARTSESRNRDNLVSPTTTRPHRANDCPPPPREASGTASGGGPDAGHEDLDFIHAEFGGDGVGWSRSRSFSHDEGVFRVGGGVGVEEGRVSSQPRAMAASSLSPACRAEVSTASRCAGGGGSAPSGRGCGAAWTAQPG